LLLCPFDKLVDQLRADVAILLQNCGGANGNDPLNIIVALISISAFETLGSLGSTPMLRSADSKAGGTISCRGGWTAASAGLLGGLGVSPFPFPLLR